MPDNRYSDYFLGANTPNGFCSMFEQSFSAADGWQVYILKGGPGTGKSTLMRTVFERAQQAGLFAERIHCSSDPDSLDAVIIPSQRRAIYDGTAPHVLEPSLPGACEEIVNLGQAWDKAVLYERRGEIAALSAECSAFHRQATAMLRCADAFRRRLADCTLAAADRGKISRAADRMCRRFGLQRRSSAVSVPIRRLATAVTPEGINFAAEEYISSFGRVVPIYDRSGEVAALLLSALRERLTERGCRVVECPCSQDFSRTEHLLLPEEDICFTVRSDAHGGEVRTEADTRAVHAARFMSEDFGSGRHPQMNADRREMLRFTAHAADCMKKAKAVHDRLEEQYRDAMDFGVVGELAEETAKAIIS